MSWNPLASSDVLNEFTPVEQATLNGLQGAAGNLDAIVANVINAVRGSIVAGGNQLGPVATVPDQLRSEVIAIARWKWLASFPQLKSLQTDARRIAAQDAQALVNLVSSEKADRPRIEIPAAGTAVATQAPVGAVASARPGLRVHRHGYHKLGST